MTKDQQIRNESIMKRWCNHGKIEIGRVFVLADMARNNVWPDGTFSDAECSIWNEFMSARDVGWNDGFLDGSK